MKSLRYAAIMSASLLAACSGNDVKSTLGLDRAAPDEFRVVSQPPLSVPPQFNLRPPATVEEMPNVVPASKQAESLMVGNNNTPAGMAPSSGGKVDTAVIPVTVGASPAGVPSSTVPLNASEQEFMKEAGADQSNPKIREVLMADRIAALQQPEEDHHWWQVLPDKPKPDPIVNANGESQRIQTDAQEGQPVTQGDTPVVKAKDTGLLGQIFGY